MPEIRDAIDKARAYRAKIRAKITEEVESKEKDEEEELWTKEDKAFAVILQVLTRKTPVKEKWLADTGASVYMTD
jgi:hypothetical protein